MWARYIEGRDDGMVAIIVMTTDPAVGVVGHKEAGTQEENGEWRSARGERAYRMMAPAKSTSCRLQLFKYELKTTLYIE